MKPFREFVLVLKNSRWVSLQTFKFHQEVIVCYKIQAAQQRLHRRSSAGVSSPSLTGSSPRRRPLRVEIETRRVLATTVAAAVPPVSNPISDPSTFPSPPSTREEAVVQARNCLTDALRRIFKGQISRPSRKAKQQQQPRFRVEVPVADDSPSSLCSLVTDIFFPKSLISRQSSTGMASVLVFWPDASMAESARSTSEAMFIHTDLTSSVSAASAAELAVFVAMDISLLDPMRAAARDLGTKPVAILNPRWSLEDEKDLGGAIRSFVSSFEVIYSFTGLEVKGILSRRRGVVFRHAGTTNPADGWVVMVEGKQGRLEKVSQFDDRPSIAEVETLLYNLAASSSPINNSIRFLRSLASTVIGDHKEKQK